MSIMSDMSDMSEISEMQEQVNQVKQSKPEDTQSKPESDKQIYDKCKKVVEFHNHLIRFLSMLKNTFPEMVKRIGKCYKYYTSVSRATYINKIIMLMEPHIKHISEYDEGIFSSDYVKGKLQFIVGLDFKEIFKIIESDDFDGELRETTIKHIFNHLQSIYVLAQMANSQVSDFNAAVTKQKKFMINMLKNVNMDEQLKKQLEKIAEEEASEENGHGMDAFKKFGDMFKDIFGDENNFISKLAKDISNDLELGNGCDNPVEAITELFANNGEKLQELIIKIGDNLKTKIEKGEITQEEITNMTSKVSNIIDIPVPEEDPSKFFEKEFAKLEEADQEKFKHIKAIIEKDNNTWTDEEQQEFQVFSTHCMKKSASDLMSNFVKQQSS